MVTKIVYVSTNAALSGRFNQEIPAAGSADRRRAGDHELGSARPA